TPGTTPNPETPSRPRARCPMTPRPPVVPGARRRSRWSRSMDESAAIDQLPGGLPAGLEAVLMVADQPVSEQRLAQIFEVSEIRITQALRALASEYDSRDRPRGFELRRVASGWRIYS